MRETTKAIQDGADEIDMVLNYQLMKKKGSSVADVLLNDVESLVRICHNHQNKNGERVILKVIVESGLLNAAETENATHICLDAGADFIKTSTGMVAVGAELDKVKIMKQIIKDEYDNERVGYRMKIKASGGVNKANIDSFAPYVDRFGMGAKAVEELNGLGKNTENY
jgi:deoxyribose-phosphate aldolase